MSKNENRTIGQYYFLFLILNSNFIYFIIYSLTFLSFSKRAHTKQKRARRVILIKIGKNLKTGFEWHYFRHSSF